MNIFRILSPTEKCHVLEDVPHKERFSCTYLNSKLSKLLWPVLFNVDKALENFWQVGSVLPKYHRDFSSRCNIKRHQRKSLFTAILSKLWVFGVFFSQLLLTPFETFLNVGIWHVENIQMENEQYCRPRNYDLFIISDLCRWLLLYCFLFRKPWSSNMLNQS